MLALHLPKLHLFVPIIHLLLLNLEHPCILHGFRLLDVHHQQCLPICKVTRKRKKNKPCQHSSSFGIIGIRSGFKIKGCIAQSRPGLQSHAIWVACTVTTPRCAAQRSPAACKQASIGLFFHLRRRRACTF